MADKAKPAGQGDTDTGKGAKRGKPESLADGVNDDAAADKGSGDDGGKKDADTGDDAGKAGDGSADDGKKKDEAPGEGDSDDKGGKDPDADASGKAPDKYELTLPEGDWISDDVREQVEEIARANGYSNEEAQALLELQADTLAAQSARFLEVTQADPDYGGKHLAETQRLVRAVVNRVRPKGHARAESFRRFLARTGGGNHIEVASFLADLGKLMAEDRPAGESAGGAGGEKSDSELFYGGPKKK